MEKWLSLWSIGQHGTLSDFRAIKQSGFNGIEIWAEQHRSKEYLEYAKQVGLKIGMHLPFHDLNLATPDPVVYERTFHVLTEWMETLSIYGGQHATFHGGYAWSSEERDETFIRIQERLLLLNEKAKQYGIELLLENLIPDKLNYCHHIASNVEEWLDLIHKANIKACLDIGHLAVMGDDLETTIAKLGSALGAVHLSDNDRKSDLHLLPGEGENLSKDLNSYLEANQYSGPIVYEINPYKYSLQDIIEHITKVNV
ncbi:sugar phosphate isomerase/epimerase family protein [Heyndrickxia vini]|uniref:Sugar phosphate isomerase/epimerase n=1 Tax=Heyndrickxia vini TaxID=1476025 RepID=A0ABX7E1B4_9BACI|nr:sugar phosphate isomerase/epimerase family protein [Heyndrickxia vini]QQZ08984.1 sugar phosphate isomerase/epimerase [Heyndrickxia vini]